MGLARIGEQLPFVEAAPPERSDRPTSGELLSALERGEMSVRDVLKELKAVSEREPS